MIPVTFKQACDGVFRQGIDLLSMIGRIQELPEREKHMAQKLLGDALVLVFQAKPETAVDRAQKDQAYQAFRARLMPERKKRSRKPKPTAH